MCIATHREEAATTVLHQVDGEAPGSMPDCGDLVREQPIHERIIHGGFGLQGLVPGLGIEPQLDLPGEHDVLPVDPLNRKVRVLVDVRRPRTGPCIMCMDLGLLGLKIAQEIGQAAGGSGQEICGWSNLLVLHPQVSRHGLGGYWDRVRWRQVHRSDPPDDTLNWGHVNDSYKEYCPHLRL